MGRSRQLLCRSLDVNYGARRHAELLCRSQYANSAPGATRVILKVYMKIFAATPWNFRGKEARRHCILRTYFDLHILQCPFIYIRLHT